MVQTSIGNTLAFGKPGEHGNSQPWFADAGIVGATGVIFGNAVKYDANGKVIPLAASDANAAIAGIAVSPNQHVRQILPDSTASIEAAVNDTIAVAKKGAWFVEIKGLAAAPTVKKLVSGVKWASGKWALDDTAANQYAVVLDYQVFEVPGEDASTYDVGLLVRIK